MFSKILVEAGADSKAFCVDLLNRGKVSSTPSVAFGPTGQDHLRLSFCVDGVIIHKAFDRVDELFA